MTPTTRRSLSISCLAVAAVLVGHSAWIPLKARAAQYLLDRAWQQSRFDGQAPKPWPWADTWPVARLRAPTHAVDHVVLHGATGSVLAFAPGQLAQKAGSRQGAIAVAGHRDTHFAFLRHLAVGDPLEWQSAGGTPRRYRVAWTRIVDHTEVEILAAPPDALTLITCWPFDAVASGGQLRYVVRAMAQDELDAVLFDEPLPPPESVELPLLELDSPAFEEPPDSLASPLFDLESPFDAPSFLPLPA